jgi:hypothetical protein
MDGGDRTLASGRPDPAEDGFEPNPVLVERPDLDRTLRRAGTLFGNRFAQRF